MKNVLLTSTGLEHKTVADKFLSILPKSAGELKILFIPTASRTEEEMFFVRKSLNELLSVGVNNDNVVWFDPDDETTHRDNTEIDCVYVCGGNTFYLLRKLKESGYFTKIQKWANDGLLYVGASAGSVIATPDINYILCMDVNDCGLEDTSGLSFVSASVIPHYTDEFAEAATSLRKKGVKVETISDSEALTVRGEEVEKVD
jgi:dipeptidase E